MMKKIVLAAVLVTSFGSIATLPLPAAAQAIIINTAPPEPRHERIPPPRNGYVWAPGYWDWRQGRHQWVKGHWERERRGYVYHQPRWQERDGRWEMNRGRWDRDDHRGGRNDRGDHHKGPRDSDHDGVPNFRDDHPNNPRRD